MKNRLPILPGLIVTLVLLAVGVLPVYIGLITMDLSGTFHNTTSLADLDNDGDLDVVLQNVRSEAEFTSFAVITLWFNQGSGDFTAKRIDNFQHEAGWASTAGDVDQDGDADLFVYHGYRLRIDRNLGGAQNGQPGEFKYSQFISQPKTDAQYGSLLLGDLNNDSLMDGLVTGCCGRVFTLDEKDDSPNFTWEWINASSPDGKLVTQSSTVSALEGLAIQGAALGDMDSDGDLDLFAAVIAPSIGRNTDPADRVLFNDGSGNFTDSGQRLGEEDSSSVALGDMDKDGDLDALVGNDAGSTIWLNQGGIQNGQEGTFISSNQTISGKQTTAVFLSDLDGDGDLDALIAERKQATVWWNDGQAKFTKSDQRLRFTNRHGLAIGDFNNDNLPDIFAAEYSNDYRIWYNQGDGTFQSTLIP